MILENPDSCTTTPAELKLTGTHRPRRSGACAKWKLPASEYRSLWKHCKRPWRLRTKSSGFAAKQNRKAHQVQILRIYLRALLSIIYFIIKCLWLYLPWCYEFTPADSPNVYVASSWWVYLWIFRISNKAALSIICILIIRKTNGYVRGCECDGAKEFVSLVSHFLQYLYYSYVICNLVNARQRLSKCWRAIPSKF